MSIRPLILTFLLLPLLLVISGCYSHGSATYYGYAPAKPHYNYNYVQPQTYYGYVPRHYGYVQPRSSFYFYYQGGGHKSKRYYPDQSRRDDRNWKRPSRKHRGGGRGKRRGS